MDNMIIGTVGCLVIACMSGFSLVREYKKIYDRYRIETGMRIILSILAFGINAHIITYELVKGKGEMTDYMGLALFGMIWIAFFRWVEKRCYLNDRIASTCGIVGILCGLFVGHGIVKMQWWPLIIMLGLIGIGAFLGYKYKPQEE